MAEESYELKYDGYCPICEAPATFHAKDKWLRGSLMCTSCPNGSVPRERALALVLDRVRPTWRDLKIHESSPADRGISVKLSRECKDYIGTQYYPGKPLGEMVEGFRNETLEKQTFEDQTFDIVVSQDVFEHVWRPDRMTKDIYRTLKVGGAYICTFPIKKHQVQSHRPRCMLEGGKIVHFEAREIHGNPASGEGALVTFDYGYNIHLMMEYWAPFSIEISRFIKRDMGILGEFTEVIVCERLTDAPARAES